MGEAGRTFGAVALALATIADGVLSLGFTIVFARALGPAEYGSLAAIVSTFLVITVAGSALQLAVARRVGREASSRFDLSAAKAVGSLVGAAAASLLLAALAKGTLENLLGVKDYWADAFIIPAAIISLAGFIERGILLGRRAYGAAAVSLLLAPAGWLLFGAALFGAGLGLSGVVAGIALAEVSALLVLRALALRLKRPGATTHVVPLRVLVQEASGPMAGLVLFAALQNLDVIMVRYAIADTAVASSYAAAAVMAKAIVWIGIGAGLFIAPEAARRRARGETGRALMGQGIALICAVVAPTITIYLLFSRALLDAVFGPGFAEAAQALPLLTVAMTFLACANIPLQFLLSLGRYRSLPFLALAALIEAALIFVFAPDLQAIALAIGAVNVAIALALGKAALASAKPRHAPS